MKIKRVSSSLSWFDFGIVNFRYLVAFIFTALLILVSVSPYTISVDGFFYLKSAEVLFTPSFSESYQWVREPGYPLFIKSLESIGGLMLVVVVQGIIVAFGITSTILAFYRTLGVKSTSWKSYLGAGIAISLTGGYANTILQQALFIGFFGLLLLIVERIVSSGKVDLKTTMMTFFLVSFSTLTAVFIGMAFSLAIIASILFSGVRGPRILFGQLAVVAISFLLVLIPWSIFKSSQGPPGAPDSFEIGTSKVSSILSDLNPVKEVYELLQTQLALLNLSGELAPSSGLGIANENLVFGSPAYSPDELCGRFLIDGFDGEALWGKININYKDKCVAKSPLLALSSINMYLSRAFFPITGLAIVFHLILSIRMSRTIRPLVLPVVFSLSPYLLLDLSISRYGIFVVPLGSMLAVAMLSRGDLFFGDRGRIERTSPTKELDVF